jgi:hypothetical protein
MPAINIADATIEHEGEQVPVKVIQATSRDGLMSEIVVPYENAVEMAEHLAATPKLDEPESGIATPEGASQLATPPEPQIEVAQSIPADAKR